MLFPALWDSKSSDSVSYRSTKPGNRLTAPERETDRRSCIDETGFSFCGGRACGVVESILYQTSTWCVGPYDFPTMSMCPSPLISTAFASCVGIPREIIHRSNVLSPLFMYTLCIGDLFSSSPISPTKISGRSSPVKSATWGLCGQNRSLARRCGSHSVDRTKQHVQDAFRRLGNPLR